MTATVSRFAHNSHPSHKPEAQARDGQPSSFTGASSLCRNTLAKSASGERCRQIPYLPWTLIASVILLAGCATVGNPLADLPDDVAATRADREEKAVEQFEQTRDNALYQAALARWRDGDAAACESMLVRLLQRSDEHREARLMLADLYASTGKPKAAEQHLRLLTERNADDAQAHHSLGMLLGTTGTPDEALQHLRKAAELEPDNELYSLSYDAAKADLRKPVDGDPNSHQERPDEMPYFCEIEG